MTQAPINAQNTCAAYPPYSGKDPLWDEFWPTELKDLPPSNYIQQEGVVSKVSDELISCLEKICHAIHYLDGNRDPAAIRTLVTDYRERAGSAKCDLDRILRLAVSRGRLSIVKQLVKEHGANLNQSDNLGRTAIFYLAVEDDLDVAEYTIARTCQDSGERTLDHRDSSDRTVLWYATRWGAGNTVTLLLSRGVCPTLSAEPFGLIQDRDDILSTLSFSKLVQLEPDMPIIFCQAGPERSYCNTSSITEFQRSSNWWSERSVYYLGTQSPDSLLWLHFPSANGDLIMAVGDWLQKFKNPEGLDIRAFYTDTFRDPSTQPDDRMLLYREPLYQSANSGSTVITTLVFPYLVMRDTVQQEEERDWHEQLIMQISNGQPEMKDYVRRHFHQERTLDEAYYPGLSRVVLSSLNKDQVISREFNEEAKKKNGTPILMVGQLWFWRLGQTVISSSSLFEADDLDLPPRKYDTDALKLIMGLRVADCIEELGHLRERRLLPPPLQIFEAGVARILSDVTKYMDSSGSSKPDIEKERDFLKRISDIQGELAMIQDVLNQQTEVLKDVLQDPPEDFVSQDKRQGGSLSHRWDRVVRSEKTLKNFYKRTEKISADAARIEKIIQDELNLKRTFAAMEDARTSLSLGIAVIGFTVITIIFAPLAFMTSLFALPVDEFEKRKVKINSGSPEEEQEAYTASYIGKWFATAELVSLGVTALVVVISLWLLGSWGKAGGKKKDAVRKGNGKKKDAVGKGETETKGALSWIFFRNPRIQQWKQRLWPWKGKGKETPGNNTENRKKPADPERGPE